QSSARAQRGRTPGQPRRRPAGGYLRAGAARGRVDGPRRARDRDAGDEGSGTVRDREARSRVHAGLGTAAMGLGARPRAGHRADQRRMLRVTNTRTLVSFDIDGTLEIGEPPGIVTIALVHVAKRLGYVVGSCS